MWSSNKKDILPLGERLVALSHRHLVVAFLVIIMVCLALAMAPSKTAQAKRAVMPLSADFQLPLPPSHPTPATESAFTSTTHLSSTDTHVSAPEPHWVTVEVRSGDNLSTLFERAKLNGNDLHELITSTPEAKQLIKIYPGQQLMLKMDENHQLQALKHIQSTLKTTLYERTDEQGYLTSIIEIEPENRRQYSSAIITSSLYNAAHEVGLPKSLILGLADIYGGIIDFVYDIRVGDSFSVLYEQRYVNDHRYGHGTILAAQFTNRGKTYYAYRYQHEDGSIGYYDENGASMQKTFLRAPVDFTRISSHFNLKRLHPISKVTKPHRGIDYAAATGTPVYAAGDGRVVASGYTKANGNYVVIQHSKQYTTKYLHLHERSVKQGERVKQRQVIGSVGSTGYATGPHLHYEFLVNGVHHDPRTITQKLPTTHRIAGAEKSHFLMQMGELQNQLASYSSQQNLATANEQLTVTHLDG